MTSANVNGLIACGALLVSLTSAYWFSQAKKSITKQLADPLFCQPFVPQNPNNSPALTMNFTPTGLFYNGVNDGVNDPMYPTPVELTISANQPPNNVPIAVIDSTTGYSFSFPSAAPSTPGVYALNLRMFLSIPSFTLLGKPEKLIYPNISCYLVSDYTPEVPAVGKLPVPLQNGSPSGAKFLCYGAASTIPTPSFPPCSNDTPNDCPQAVFLNAFTIIEKPDPKTTYSLVVQQDTRPAGWVVEGPLSILVLSEETTSIPYPLPMLAISRVA